MRLLPRVGLSAFVLVAAIVSAVPTASAVTNTRLAAMPAAADVLEAVVGPNDSYVLYLAKGGSGGPLYTEAWTVKLEQNPSPRLVSKAADGVPIIVDGAGFSGDGTHVYFTGRRDEFGDVDHALYRIAVDGSGTATRMSAPVVSTLAISSWFETPDGATIIYGRSDGEWFSVPATGSQADAVPLAGVGYPVGVSNTHLIYVGGADLYRMPLAGGSSVLMSTGAGELAAWDVHITPDSAYVVFTEDDDDDGYQDLFSVPSGGTSSEVVRLNELLGVDQRIEDVAIARDSGHVLYRLGTSSIFEPEPVYSVPIAGPATSSVQLNGGLGDDSFVGEYVLDTTPDGSRAFFVAMGSYGGPEQLVSVPIGGPASAAVELSPGHPARQEIGSFDVSPDGARAVFSVYDGVAWELFSAPVDGSSTAVKIATPEYGWDFAGDGASILYAGASGLYRVPVTGPASATEQLGSGTIRDFDSTTDGAIVVYVADQVTSEVYELFASGTLPAGGTEPPPTGDVVRWSGPDRFATAAAISAANFNPGVPVATIAVGGNFPDALAGGPAAAIKGGPILLVDTDSIPAATAQELSRLVPKSIVIMGGPAAVSSAVASQLQAYTTGAVTRWSGPDRFATAAAISAATFAPGVPLAAVAVGTNFPDALAGGPAAAVTGGPILLVNTDSIPAATAQELSRLAPKSIAILGGPAAVSSAVASQLQAYTTGAVTRWSGPDRFATAAATSAATFSPGVPIVAIAVGSKFPDALAGGPAAGLLGGPILLVNTDSIPDATIQELSRLAPKSIVILGGPAAVSSAVEAQLHAYLD
jgi:putative cell wall-binding protein